MANRAFLVMDVQRDIVDIADDGSGYLPRPRRANGGARAAGGAKLPVNGSAQWDISVQRPIIDSVAATHPEGPLISPVDTAALTPSPSQIENSGAKVVLVDTAVDDTSIAVSRISSDNEAGGKQAAKALAQGLHQRR
jgi:ABC-type sugar transport system substrate-binding protein